MTSKNKEPDVKFDPEMEISEQIKKLLEKKIRNLEKRKLRLEEGLKRKEKGEKLVPEQEEALKVYPGVIEMTQILQSLVGNVKQLFSQQSRWLKKEKKLNQKKNVTGKVSPVQEEASAIPAQAAVIDKDPPSSNSPEPEKKPDELPKHLKQCLEFQANVYRLLQCFGEDSVRDLFLDSLGHPGVINLEQEELDRLDEIHEILNPLSSVPEKTQAHDPLGTAAFMSTEEVKTTLGPVYQHWVSLYLHSQDPMLEDGTEFSKVAELCEKLIDCDFFKSWKPVKPVVEAPPPEIPVATLPVAKAAMPTETAEFNVDRGYSNDNGFSSHVPTLPAGAPGAVERMLQTLGTPFQFMQNPSTPQPPAETTHSLTVSAPIIKPTEHLPPTKEVTNYWTTSNVTPSETVAPPPGLTASVHEAGENVGSKMNTIDWNNDNFNSQYEATQASTDLPKATSSNNREVLMTTSTPPVNLSWADKVRHSVSGSAVPPPMASYPTVQQSAGHKTNANSGFVTSDANFSAEPIPSGGMDVFDTASHSQFISSHPEGGTGRRGGHFRGAGRRGGGEGRGGSYGGRGSGTYRGGSRGAGKGSYNNFNGQRPSGRTVQN